MAIKSRKQRSGYKTSLEGEITIYEANELCEKLLKQFSACDFIDINLQSVTEIDTAGIQILLSLKREAISLGKTVKISMHSDCVVEAFELMNIAHEFGDPIVLSNKAHA